MENGLRTLNIASLNPDSLKEHTTQQEIINELTKRKIHIATIQETKMAKDLSYQKDNYRITTAAADKNEETKIATGGAAIMIHESIQQNIIQIKRDKAAEQ